MDLKTWNPIKAMGIGEEPLTDAGAERDLRAHNLPTLFSYRQAYFVGAKAQSDIFIGKIRAIRRMATIGISIATVALILVAVFMLNS